jgi:hypothetical protein
VVRARTCSMFVGFERSVCTNSSGVFILASRA